jgi:hypothetical protein
VSGRTRQGRQASSPQDASQKRLPIHAWNIRIADTYPASMSGETFEQIQAMLHDNDAESDRHKTRGIPRPGAALLPGLVYCGACGHTRLVQDQHSTRSLCTYLRHQYGGPVCQDLPADAVDAYVVEAFSQALAPLELDV